MIFFAEDDDDNGDLVEAMLHSLGYAAWRARHGGELLEQIKQQTPDLILLDLEMPVLDGVSTFHALRQDDRLRNIPIVAMSGKVQPNLSATLEETGFTAFLPKPFSKAKLGQLLDALNF